jgi:hypothetical protein
LLGPAALNIRRTVRRACGALLAGWAEFGLAGLRLFFFSLILFRI